MFRQGRRKASIVRRPFDRRLPGERCGFAPNFLTNRDRVAKQLDDTPGGSLPWNLEDVGYNIN